MKLGRLRSLQGMLRLSRLCKTQTSWSRQRWALQAPLVRMRIHHRFLLHAIAAAPGRVAAAPTRHRRAAGARTRSLAPVTASRLAVRRCRALQAMAAALLHTALPAAVAFTRPLMAGWLPPMVWLFRAATKTACMAPLVRLEPICRPAQGSPGWQHERTWRRRRPRRTYMQRVPVLVLPLVSNRAIRQRRRPGIAIL